MMHLIFCKEPHIPSGQNTKTWTSRLYTFKTPLEKKKWLDVGN